MQPNTGTNTEQSETAIKRRAFLAHLGKWSWAVIGATCGHAMLPHSAQAVNWNDCRGDNPWLNSSGSGGHWINNQDAETRLQGGDSGDPPRDGKARGRPWMNGNRDGWTNRQDCRGTWVNF